MLGAKPFCFIGWGRMPSRPAAWRRMADRGLLFGMAPGGGRLEGELREFMPVMQRIAAAGWQPVPHARAKGLWVERFGRKPGRLYFAVRNLGKTARKSNLSIDLAALGAGRRKVTLEELKDAGLRNVRRSGSRLSCEVTILPRRTAVLALGRG